MTDGLVNTISKFGGGFIKKLKVLIALISLVSFHSGIIHAKTLREVSFPCSLVLKPVMDIPNAQGSALITKVKKPYTSESTSTVRERKGVGIYADWLPSPSSFGAYDQYEGFAQIKGEISWRFKLYLVKEDTPSWFGGNPWAGKFDEISAKLPMNASVEVRLSNSKTNKLGPVILQNILYRCHK